MTSGKKNALTLLICDIAMVLVVVPLLVLLRLSQMLLGGLNQPRDTINNLLRRLDWMLTTHMVYW